MQYYTYWREQEFTRDVVGMETDDKVAIVTTMLRKILLFVSDLAETVRDIKEGSKIFEKHTGQNGQWLCIF